MGYFCLLLHAHLPFVRHPEHEEFFEEDWLFEAIAETYIPLLKMLRALAADRARLRLTMTLTPTLCAMLNDGLLRERAARYLARGEELAALEMERTASLPELRTLAEFYRGRFREALDFYEHEVRRDLVAAFAHLQQEGLLEIIACAATHGFLPLMEACPEALRAQVLIGVDDYRATFGRDPAGFWLPECGYVPAVGPVLRDAGVRWFVLDAHGVMFGTPRPRFGVFAPYHTPAGPAVFARDRESSRQVWSAREGYPGDPAYRDFYRDIGTDLPEEYLHRVLPDTGHRRPTGIKYHRITGHEPKDIYRRDWALGAADAHAAHYLESRLAQFRQLEGMLPFPPVILAPFDAELFGHWWFEGPEFLNFFLRKAAWDQKEFELITPTDVLARHPTQQLLAPAPTTWGNRGYSEVWLDRSNCWIYPHLHAAARRMTACARARAKTRSPRTQRVLQQMARELLLAQSSDWAFLMRTGTAADYAARRTKTHILRFNRLADGLESGKVDEAFLAECEARDNLFPNLEWRHYC